MKRQLARGNWSIPLLALYFLLALTSANGGFGVFILISLLVVLVVRLLLHVKGLDSISIGILAIGLLYAVKFFFSLIHVEGEIFMQDVVDMATFYFAFILTAILYLTTRYLPLYRIRKSVGLLIIFLFIDGFFEFFFGYSFLRDGARDGIRVHSIFLNNHYGSYMFFLYVLYLILAKKSSFAASPMDLLIGCLVLIATLMAMSRLAFILSASLLLIQSAWVFIDLKKKVLSLILLALPVVVIAFSLIIGQIQKSEYGGQLNSYILLENIHSEQKGRRYAIWESSVEAIKRNPIFGIAPVEFVEQINKTGHLGEVLPHPHSVILELLLYSGLPLFLLVYFLLTIKVYSSSGLRGLILLFYVIPIFGPGSTSNASWMLILSFSIALLLDNHKAFDNNHKLLDRTRQS